MFNLPRVIKSGKETIFPLAYLRFIGAKKHGTVSPDAQVVPSPFVVYPAAHVEHDACLVPENEPFGHTGALLHDRFSVSQ